MYFLRYFKSGGADYDPRQKHWAELKCDVCGNLHQIEVTGTKMGRFNPDEDLVCPSCGMKDFMDRRNQIRSKIARLTESRDRIDVEISELLVELESDTVEVVHNTEVFRMLS
jgi:uncharacterized Zn finger protein (UPF0148 family)